MLKNELNLECFSENLKQLIKKNNIKNVDLANHLGLSKSAISNYISGVSVPKMETVAKIASYFDVDFENLISLEIDTDEPYLGEPGKITYNIPVFHKSLNSDKIIYRGDNYIGNITSPLPTKDSQECYAVKLYDDSMKKFGMTKESMAIFTTSSEVNSGDIAAVFIKSKKEIFIRSVQYEKKKILLISDDATEEYKITKNDCDAVVLGKVIYATFNPNNKEDYSN